MEKKIRGRVWKFGDNINTDLITPGKYENLPFDEMSSHCLEPVETNFAKNVKENDILVAGENFGCGSAREIAPKALKHLKVGAIIAKSYARTFFRNAIAIGLPVLLSKEAHSKCSQKDILEVDFEQSRVKNTTLNADINVESIDSYIYKILMKGGIFSILEELK